MASESLSNRLAKHQLPQATSAQSAAQATTNDYAIVPESLLDVSGKNSVQYTVKNTGANTLTGKLCGRVKSAAGAASDWVDITSPAAADVAAGAVGAFNMAACPWSEVAVFVESKVDGSAGAALVHGIAKLL
jgi:hypothetical protein